ncbi:MAG: SH3 domain-containing protein [Clostridia bacterium]|nr:SH3 domain-containing protein [Clostridia bacterium]
MDEPDSAQEAPAQVDYVVVTADSGKIRTEPSISGGLIKTAYKGETYELIEESGDWYIIDVDGRTGYLHTGVAEIQ